MRAADRPQRTRPRQGPTGGPYGGRPCRPLSGRGSRSRRGALLQAGRLAAGGGMIDSCEPCLRRGFLLAHLAPRIAGLLQSRGPRTPGLLSLKDEELITAAAGRRVKQALAFLDSFDGEAERRSLARSETTVLCHHADAYPSGLRDLGDPPAVLFGAGRQDALAALANEPAVAVVGTRRASPYGTEVAYALGRGLGRDRRARRQRPRAGDRRSRPPGLPGRRGDSDRGPGLRSGRRLPPAPPQPPRAREGGRHRALGAPARHRAVPVELPRPEPDHGRASRS